MNLENPTTFKELIESLVSNHEDITFSFYQSSVTEINDIHFVEIIWESDTVTELNIPYNDTELPLNEESEYDIQPKFSQSKDGKQKLHNRYKEGIHTLNYENDIEERGFKKLELMCSEVTLSEDKFIEFIEQGSLENSDEVVEIVEVSSFRRPEDHTANIFSSLIVDGNVDDIRPNLDDDIHFNMNLRMPEGHVLGESGLLPSNRFDHVDRITIDGTQYPVTITTRPVEDTAGGSGQIVHISDFAQKHTPNTPNIKISDEIERISWGEFLSSNDTWPEGPGLGIHR